MHSVSQGLSRRLGPAAPPPTFTTPTAATAATAATAETTKDSAQQQTPHTQCHEPQVQVPRWRRRRRQRRRQELVRWQVLCFVTLCAGYRMVVAPLLFSKSAPSPAAFNDEVAVLAQGEATSTREAFASIRSFRADRDVDGGEDFLVYDASNDTRSLQEELQPVVLVSFETSEDDRSLPVSRLSRRHLVQAQPPPPQPPPPAKEEELSSCEEGDSTSLLQVYHLCYH